MALFALWRDDSVSGVAEALHRRVLAEAHIVPALVVTEAIDTPAGRWQIAAFAAATHYLSPAQQVWAAPGQGACLLHGVAWRMASGAAHIVDAAGFAAVLDRHDAQPPADLFGEYAVARLLPDGTLIAFGDPAGVHQLFHRPDRPNMVASRARFLAALADDLVPEPLSGLWLATIGYRVGSATGWRGVRQLGQSEMLVGDVQMARPGRIDRFGTTRGRAAGGPALLDAGIAEAIAAIRLAAGDGPVLLPVTGGKDSRAVLALCLAAGLRERLTLTTRGLAHHPDVVAAEHIAAAIGVPHRRDPPRAGAMVGEDVASFVAAMATHVWQTDGGIGGWDLLIGNHPGQATMLTGHLGEVLKGVAKQAAVDADPVAMVMRHTPFDPLGLLLPEARAMLVAHLTAQADLALAEGAEPGDLTDLFYYRNRIPNWLGGIRGVRAHECQPIMPLGAPSLQRLAFLLSPEERTDEAIHFAIVQACAPELVALPFAHQRWSPGLADAPQVEPLLAPAGSSLFGNWQWRINTSPALRHWLGNFFDNVDIPLWDGIDRAILRDRLRDRRFDYADAIALLGLVAAAFHQAELVRPQAIGSDPAETNLRTPVSLQPRKAAIAGHVDLVGGAGRRIGPDQIAVAPGGQIRLSGWAWAPDWPGASLALDVEANGRRVAAGEASAARPDLAQAGIGTGQYGFTLVIDAADLTFASRLTIAHAGAPIASFALIAEEAIP